MSDRSMQMTADSATTVLATAEWRERASMHRERVQRWTRPHRERHARKEAHPVYDFLFQYYSYSTGKLAAWHPEPHEALADSAEARECFAGAEYRVQGGVIARDASALDAADRERLASMVHILRGTRDRPANFACFGMHEWAMVFGGHDVRHADVAPLRLPQHEVDAFVTSRAMTCSHFDAFRFFAPDAKPLNRVQLQPSSRQEREQPGCIHANMDLYRWAYTAMPWIGSELLVRCFELAVELRELDMRASPCDLSALGFAPVCVETAEGRDEYQRRQRELSGRASVLREALVDVVGALLQAQKRTTRAGLAATGALG